MGRILVNGRLEMVADTYVATEYDANFKEYKVPIIMTYDEESASGGIDAKMTSTPVEFVVPLPSEMSWSNSEWTLGFLGGIMGSD